ncbi:MAG TPA: dihydroorotase [Phycisphaerae bacterium]|nr:dihydroorotase [Phycisphaerae bacterium]
MNTELRIAGGRVIDPSQGMDQIADVEIAYGKIAAIVPSNSSAPSPLKPQASSLKPQIIDATGKIVCPGLIDMHVHLREPGNEDEETIATGSAAAVAGGFTSVACMPNTEPALDTEAMIEFVYRQAARAARCNVYPIGAITKARAGKELAEMGQMVRAGAVAFSDDGCGVADAAVMFRALQYAAMFNKPVIQHCEDASLAAGGCMNAGLTATRLGLPGSPAIAEEAMIQRDLLLARETGARYHVAHISTMGSVERVRQARREDVAVTTEVCPHHLLLTEENVLGYDTNYKMNPPLRGRRDIEACIAGVVDGTIDCLVTDHAPHAREEKELDFQNAPSGIVGLEVALGLFIKALVIPGHLDWPELIRRMSTNPARLLGIPKGTLAVGADADVTIIDPNLNWIVETAKFRSNSRNCPYDGLQLKGRATHTIVAGIPQHGVETSATVPVP